MGAAEPGQVVIVFDAECILCSANAQMVIRNDKQRFFRLASMQEETGANLLRANGIDPKNPDTLIVVSDSAVLRDSDAVIYIYGRLGWPWRALASLAVLPRALRDPIYRLGARNRYRWFGKRETCWVPQTVERDRML